MTRAHRHEETRVLFDVLTTLSRLRNFIASRHIGPSFDVEVSLLIDLSIAAESDLRDLLAEKARTRHA